MLRSDLAPIASPLAVRAVGEGDCFLHHQIVKDHFNLTRSATYSSFVRFFLLDFAPPSIPHSGSVKIAGLAHRLTPGRSDS